MLHEDLVVSTAFPRNAHLMPVLSSVANALSAYYRCFNPMDNGQVELSTIWQLAAAHHRRVCFTRNRSPALPLPR